MQTPPPSGHLGIGPRVSCVKAGARWRMTVSVPGGGTAVTERDTFEQAWAARHDCYRELTERLPAIRGDAMDGPLGRVRSVA